MLAFSSHEHGTIVQAILDGKMCESLPLSGVLIIAAFLLMLFMEWAVGLTRRMRD